MILKIFVASSLLDICKTSTYFSFRVNFGSPGITSEENLTLIV